MAAIIGKVGGADAYSLLSVFRAFISIQRTLSSIPRHPWETGS